MRALVEVRLMNRAIDQEYHQPSCYIEPSHDDDLTLCVSQIMRCFDEESILDLWIFQQKIFESGGLKPVDPGWDDRLGRIDISCPLSEAKQVTRPMESDDLSFAIAKRMADPDQPRGQQVNETRLVALRENQRTGGPEVDDLRQPPEFSPFRCRERYMRRLFAVSMRPAVARQSG